MKFKKLPIAVVVVLDILLFVAILFTFCYFHHIRILWGDSGISDNNSGLESFEKPSQIPSSFEESKDYTDVYLVDVPYVVGMPADDAVLTLQNAGLGTPQIHYIISEEAAEGTVMIQGIPAGQSVGEETVITLVVAKKAEVSMPDVTGSKLESVLKILSERDIAVIITYETNLSKEEGTILRQSIPSGESVKKGSSVILVTATSQNVISLQNYVGQTYEEAAKALTDIGLQNVTMTLEYSNSVEAGKIIAQIPAKGYGVLNSSTVQFVVSSGKRPVTVTLNANGGYSENSTVTVYHASPYGNLPTPERNGYRFTGWYTSQNGGNLIDSDSEVVFTVDHTLYAHWEDITAPDKSGDFGKTLGKMFLNNYEAETTGIINLKTDQEIRDYCNAFGLTLPVTKDAQYIGLYRSHDVFLTLSQVDTAVKSSSGSMKDIRYFVFDIYVRNVENLFTQTVGKRQPLETLIDSGEQYAQGPIIAAINGDYTGNTNHCLLALRNGKLLRDSDYLGSDICVMYYDGRMETISPADYNWENIKAASPYQIWDFGPGMLTGDGKAITSYDSSAYDKSVVGARHPRSGIGYFEPGHYCFVSVDGRSDVSAGITIAEYAKIFERLGCVQAYNMDGGDSAQSYYDKEMVRVATDRDDQRTLYDIICVGEVYR